MALHFYDTLSQKKKPLKTLEADKVKMYCCGVTPYSNTHIGHTRTFFSYDLLHRVLKDASYDVAWARNITDVDDKIIVKAVAEGIKPSELVDRYVAEQTEVLEKFKLQRPVEPRVTETIPEIINIIDTLVKKEVAYASTTGVYFRVHKFPEYGKLSKNKVEELRKGCRIEVDDSKEDAVDFALWKFAKEGEPDEVIWDSPWGKGRPGWHIECSAMVNKCFGDAIDIHMGGRDLIFPHHECEIAQSEAASGKEFSSIWMHCGMVTLYGDKMSKSTNHYVSIADFLEKYPPEVLRLVFLSVCYSQPLDYTDEAAQENFKKLAKVYRTVSLVDSYASLKDSDASKKTSGQKFFSNLEKLKPTMQKHLQDDLNSSAAMASFFEFAKSANQAFATLEKKNQKLDESDLAALQTHWQNVKSWMSETLGLLSQTPEEFFDDCTKRKVEGSISEQDIEKLLAKRSQARDSKDWAAADLVRDELLSHGIQVQDTPSGMKWTVEL